MNIHYHTTKVQSSHPILTVKMKDFEVCIKKEKESKFSLIPKIKVIDQDTGISIDGKKAQRQEDYRCTTFSKK
ncbi:hypothetical protein WN55_00757 [Dufourea novaeangliae]|uniref:Uncharacterized protein n=1 Tax=Dufourea novaeangliae TaxID=178035 RepID=A0A154PB60_DUFNO|nr:hypothetical protein WN55_00757 [Dufourea novaeangliae]